MIMAGLWDFWKDSEGKWLRSCSIITTDVNELIAPLHNRMPAVLEADAWPAWLGEEKATSGELKEMLKPYASDRMAMWPVDRKVGNVRNEDPQLAEPLAVAV
jgi:putative SOS response-associated peptidase YedK